MCYPTGKSEQDYTIPANIESIGSQVFNYCANLVNIVALETVIAISDGVFIGCIGLESMVLPFTGYSRTSTNSSGLFGNIFGTTDYPNSSRVQQYYSLNSSSVFYIPSHLTSVTILGADKIPYETFYGCRTLTGIVIGNSVTEIQTKAFCGCENLISSLCRLWEQTKLQATIRRCVRVCFWLRNVWL